MIKKYSLQALQKTINTALALDEATPKKIQSLHGKIIKIIVTPLKVKFFITFSNQKLLLLANTPEEPDTVIHSNPLGLIRLSLLPVSKARSLFNDEILLTGDTELGHQIKNLFDELEIDWEGHLARFTGDVVAYQLGSLVRRGYAFKRQLTRAMQHNVTDYLQEELQTIPPKEEIYDFFAAVDTLSNDVERLQAQITIFMMYHATN